LGRSATKKVVVVVVTSFIYGIYNNISEKHVSRICNVAVILGVRFMIQVLLFPVLNVL
jgi:hypothetical protein